jgi:hypothetical protein
MAAPRLGIGSAVALGQARGREDGSARPDVEPENVTIRVELCL